MELIKKLQQKKSQAGFSLVELIVVVAIIALVAAVVVFNFGDFTSNISLRNLAQETALAVRKAQTYATSVRGINGVPPQYPSYGISFSTVSGGSGVTTGSKNFVLFADAPNAPIPTTLPGNAMYDKGANCGAATAGFGNECVESFTITTEDRVVGLCNSIITANAQGLYVCPGGGVDKADIIFNRPNPDAMIYLGNDRTPKSSVTIILESLAGKQRVVTIYATGQISTQ